MNNQVVHVKNVDNVNTEDAPGLRMSSAFCPAGINATNEI
jgi:hypothetical protein